IEHATEDSTTSTYRNGRDLFERIKDRWALTDAGKIEAEEVFSSAKEIGQTKDYYYQFVTFHQSYSYEDFIEGIRAETVDGNIQYEVKKGIFRTFCERAEEDLENGTGNNFLFVIDEINRGNISKIFGELITLIEPEKRIGAAEEIRVTLPYSGDQFGIPMNVYVLGTMNTADRSIAMMDTALRRRFDFVEMMPDSGLIRKKVGESGSIEGFNLADILDALNERIAYLYDREHTLGHAFFMNNNTLDDVKRTFENKIIPLLQEYFYDDFRKIRAILNDKNGIYITEKEISPHNLFDNKLADGFFRNNENRYALKTIASEEEFRKFLSGVLIHKEADES
ncbi:McrB family protein, partial [Trichococcus sp.]|uniref:McrB family protein n=1 Tax=Trichococcus sp. TaxID=1985464 RepID=UPI003C79760B